MIHNNFYLKYYFINNFDAKNLKKLDKNTCIIYRNYKNKTKIEKIILLKNYCKKNKIKLYLSNNIKLAMRLNLDGAYIPSFNKNLDHLSYNFKKNFTLLGSAHNFNEIKVKEIQNVEFIFLSSLFKFNKNYLGFNKFNKLATYTNLKVIALGGINNENRRKLKLTKCYGFAGISYFE
tara:strand:+ start:482 stop:1012 length:531 start_codon:yes stop_codon:yes gene_type:complete